MALLFEPIAAQSARRLHQARSAQARRQATLRAGVDA